LSGEGKKPRIKRPPGWYGKQAREERRRQRHERRQERLAMLEERRQRVEKARRQYIEHQEKVARRIATAAEEKVRKAPRLVNGIAALEGESDAMYQARVESLRQIVGRSRMLKRWDHKNEGTAETHENAARTRQGALARMFMAGHINADQLGWACEIAAVAESIEADVAVRAQAYEMRVDYSGSGRNSLVEGIMRVRREVAYGWWRERIPEPRRAVLDMLVGEPVSYSMIAIQFRMGKARARRLLIDALDLWPDAMRHAEREVDDASLAAAHSGIMGG
jgi:hypothetical protein